MTDSKLNKFKQTGIVIFGPTETTPVHTSDYKTDAVLGALFHCCWATMPPSMPLEVIDEEAELLNVGSIEVEAFQSGNKVVERIVYGPRETDIEVCRVDEILDDNYQDALEEEHEGFGGILEALSFACINTCGAGCEPCAGIYRKSILRNHNSGRNPNESPILSDRQVSFSRLEIREFDMTLGNHPSAVSGPPMSLDYAEEKIRRIVDVDEYERERALTPRRKRKQLKLSYKDRKGILHETKGFSEEEINEAWAEAINIRRQRQETLNRGLLLMLFDEFWESSVRKYNRATESLSSAMFMMY